MRPAWLTSKRWFWIERQRRTVARLGLWEAAAALEWASSRIGPRRRKRECPGVLRDTGGLVVGELGASKRVGGSTETVALVATGEGRPVRAIWMRHDGPMGSIWKRIHLMVLAPAMMCEACVANPWTHPDRINPVVDGQSVGYLMPGIAGPETHSDDSKEPVDSRNAANSLGALFGDGPVEMTIE